MSTNKNSNEMTKEMLKILEKSSMGEKETKAVHSELLVLFGAMQTLPKRLSNSAYIRAKHSRYEDFMEWWDKQV